MLEVSYKGMNIYQSVLFQKCYTRKLKHVGINKLAFQTSRAASAPNLDDKK